LLSGVSILVLVATRRHVKYHMHVRHIDRVLFSLRDDRETLPRLASILPWHSLQPTVCLCIGASRPIRLLVTFIRSETAMSIRNFQNVFVPYSRFIVVVWFVLHLFMFRQSNVFRLCMVFILIAARTGLVKLRSF
jgi:hypothetical protein